MRKILFFAAALSNGQTVHYVTSMSVSNKNGQSGTGTDSAQALES
jgi:hypothetical protein